MRSNVHIPSDTKNPDLEQMGYGCRQMWKLPFSAIPIRNLVDPVKMNVVSILLLNECPPKSGPSKNPETASQVPY
jgi:hypothetical protein